MESKRTLLVLLVMVFVAQMMAVEISETAAAAVPLVTTPSWSTLGNYDSKDVALGDVDYDGDLDLASFGEASILVYKNQGGTLDTSESWASSESTSGVTGSLVWADINNDHYPELWTSIGKYDNNAGILSSTASMNFLSSADAFTLGDVNGDGYADLVVGDTDLIQVYSNSGGIIDGTPDWNTTESNTPEALALGDMDNDAFNELAVGSRWDPLRIYENVAGTLNNVSAWNSTLVDYVGCLTWGDVAGDSFPDLFACTQPFIGGDPNRIYMNQGGTLESYPSWNSTETTYATEARFADLDGDSDLDLLVSNVPYMSGMNYILGTEMVYLNDNGNLDQTHDWDGAYHDSSHGLDVGLVDGDAYLDLLVASSEDMLQVYPGRALMYKGLAPNQPPQITSVTVNPAQPGTDTEATITVTATDAEGDTISYDFSVAPNNGTIISKTGFSAVWKAPSVAGTYTVDITVSDDQGGSSVHHESITVLPNHAPAIVSVSINPAQPGTGKQATITVTASDTDGDTLQYDFSIAAGNGTIISESGPSAVWQAPDSVRNCTINITVSDGRGGYAYRDFIVTVVESPPETGTPFFSFENVWFLLLLAVIILVVVAAIAAVAIRRRKKKVPEPPPPPEGA